MAAVLALGPGAVLSHRSAAAHWGMLPWRGAGTHITVPGANGRRRRGGVVVHHARAVDATVRDGIPVTSVAQTLLDVAATAERRTLASAIEGAEHAGLFDLRALEPLVSSGRRGAARLREALAEYDDAFTQSELEARFLALCRDHGVPRPLVNTRVCGYLVDFFWPDARLIVETDGRRHDTTRRRADDHERDAVHALAGFRTQRFRWKQVTAQPAMVAQLVLQLYAERTSCA